MLGIQGGAIKLQNPNNEHTMSESRVAESHAQAQAQAQAPETKPRKAGGKSKGRTAKTSEPAIQAADLMLVLWDTGKFPDLVQLPAGPSDPRWDSRMQAPVDHEFEKDIAVRGVHTPISVSPIDGGLYAINFGRTRVRAIPGANKLRAKKGEPALVVPLIVRATTDHEAMLLAASENEQRRQTTPSEKADFMLRMIDAGTPESDICAAFGITGPRLHEYLTIASMAPDEARAALDAGTISFSGLVSILHLDENKINAAVAQATKAQELGVKLPTRNLRAAAGQSTDPDRLPPKLIKAFIDDLKTASDIQGKHGEAVQTAARYALELVLDARKRDGFMKKLRELANG